MKKKEMGNNGLNLGDIGTIRNILMGEQLTEYELKFKELEEQLLVMKKELYKKVEQASDKVESNAVSQKEVMENRMNGLESLIHQKIEEATDKIHQDSSKDRQEIGQMLIALGEKILKGDAK